MMPLGVAGRSHGLSGMVARPMAGGMTDCMAGMALAERGLGGVRHAVVMGLYRRAGRMAVARAMMGFGRMGLGGLGLASNDMMVVDFIWAPPCSAFADAHGQLVDWVVGVFRRGPTTLSLNVSM